MSTHIQNFKNFIRHGKQARAADPPKDQPTTNVSNVHAQQTRANHGISEPVIGHAKQAAYQAPGHSAGEYSVAAGGDNRNIAAQAAGNAANVTGKNQKMQISQSDLAALVAEEREKASKMPRYPGLERFILIEKMGDGAFSNVYKARDTQTGAEVAIKVVRKFEMNSNQVSKLSLPNPALSIPRYRCHLLYHLLKCANMIDQTGRRSFASRIQETTKRSGGAH